MEIVAYFSNEPLCLRLERHRGSLNDDLGVPKRSPAGRGPTCEGGPINVIHVIFIICAHHDLFCSLI